MTASGTRRVIVIGGGLSGRAVTERLRAHHAEAVSVSGESHGTCVSLTESDGTVFARLDNGRIVSGDAAVLATGCASFGRPGEGLFVPPKLLPQERQIDPASAVVIAGSGVAAIRYALDSIAAGHRGSIYLVSRSGLLPGEARSDAPLELAPADIPLGTSLRYLFHWFRKTVQWAHERGIGMSAVVRGLKRHEPLVWRHLTAAEQRRFIVHLRPLWAAASECLPAYQCISLQDVLAKGRIRLIRGRTIGLKSAGSGLEFSFKPRGAAEKSLHVGLAVDCEDAPPGQESFSAPMVADLISRGLARPDAFKFGLDVTDNCALIGRDGKPSIRLFAIGAPTRGHFVDALDIGRIRKQSERIARSILNSRNSKAA